MTAKKNLKYWWPLGLAVLAVYLLVYLCALLIPFHSDDYSYFQQGLSVQTRIDHYFNWSGRLITDFTSSYLLNLFSRPVYMAINSVVLVLVLLSISLLPRVIVQKPYDRASVVMTFGMVFMAYWVGNPSLGQTSFWMVGSANYIWPLMWASFYLLYLFYLLGSSRSHGFFAFALLFILGFLSGLSNEATGISIAFLTFVLLFIQRQKIVYVLTGFVATLAGFMALYLAPGNYVRLTHFAESKWVALGFFERIFAHVIKRMPTALTRYWFAWLVLILLIMLLRRHRAKVSGLWKHAEVRYGCGFIALSLFSILVFLPSPAMPARAMNTALYFALIAIALFSSLLSGSFRQHALRGYAWILALCAVFFVTSYTLFFQSAVNAEIQHEIRERVILEAKQQGRDEVDIPDWYFTRLFKKRDAIDAHRNNTMASFYGIKKINWLPAYFNYAILETSQPLVADISLTDNLRLTALYEYHEFAARKDGLVLGFNQDLSRFISQNDGQFYVELQPRDQQSLDVIIDTQKVTKIGSGYYYWLPIKQLKINQLEQIFVGFSADDSGGSTARNRQAFRVELLKGDIA